MFDPLVFQLYETNNKSNFPPYDLYQENDKVFIELAVAGFGKDDISITTDGQDMIISNVRSKENYGLLSPQQLERKNNSNRHYLKSMLSYGNWSRKFRLSDNQKIEKAEYKDGILKITVKTEDVEDRVQKIDIE